ncbi:MAG: hypothetical protein AAFR38_06895 [Planctomycetota bacterium]
MKNVAIAAIAALAGTATGQITIASQDFNDVGSAASSNPTETFDMVSSGGQLTNFGASDQGFGTLGFDTFWIDTRGVGTGPVTATSDTSDFIGANSFTGFGAPVESFDGVAYAAFSEYNYEFNDGDGRVEARFDSVDASGFSDVRLSIDYFVANTGFESDDLFEIILSDGSNSQTILSLSEPGLEAANPGVTDRSGWFRIDFDISASGLDLSSLQLTVAVDTNSGSENVFIDNVAFTGIPTPGAAVALGLGGLVAARRRRA